MEMQPPIDAMKIKVAEQMTKFSAPFLAAINGIYAGAQDEGEHIGTGTFLEFRGTDLVMTSEHVVKQGQDKAYEGIAHSNGNGLLCSKITTPFKMDANLDVAYARVAPLRPPDSDRLACPESLIAESSKGLESDLLFFLGIPGTHSRYFKSLTMVIREPCRMQHGQWSQNGVDLTPRFILLRVTRSTHNFPMGPPLISPMPMV